MFHIGHLNVIKNAKMNCDFLIVGVSTDELVEKHKNKKPIINFNERVAIVESIKYVDKVIPQTAYDIQGKIQAIIENNTNVVFVGSDWQGTEKWMQLEQELALLGVRVMYLPHTDGISSSLLREKIGDNNA